MPLKPHCKAQLNIHGTTLTGLLANALRRADRDHLLAAHLQTKYCWSPDTFNNINWNAHERVLSSTYCANKTFLTKYIHGWLANNCRRSRRGERNAVCPSCHSCLIEDDVHLYQCHGRTPWHQSLLTQLEQFHHDHCTAPSIRILLRQGILGQFTHRRFQMQDPHLTFEESHNKI